MGRYIGPVEKLERREGVSLDLKGKRQLLGKTSLERRGPVPPGQHGAARRRAPSVYGQQLREAQKLKIAYGIREKQMRRLGFASTRRQARQFVGHGHVLVDGRRLDIPSATVGDESLVQIKPGSPVEPVAREAADDIGLLPAWLQVDHEALAGKVLRAPERSEIAMPASEQLVIERYARR
ncbi:MAG TPA: S4 domain-containing protein [Solirubrobacterales bacterium]|nr:S4 domain-containing protein [Solirubrobacterales bacterium]